MAGSAAIYEWRKYRSDLLNVSEVTQACTGGAGMHTLGPYVLKDGVFILYLTPAFILMHGIMLFFFFL